MFSSSHRGCSVKQVVLKDFRNIHWETPMLHSLVNKAAAPFSKMMELFRNILQIKAEIHVRFNIIILN